MSGRVVLPGVDSSLGNHEERIRALERASSGLPMQAVYLSGVSGYTLPDTGDEIGVDLQGGYAVFDAPALTDSPEVFSTKLMVGGAFAGVHGLNIASPGLYGVFIQAVNGTETLDPTAKAQSLAITVEGTAFFTESDMNWGGDFTVSAYGRQDVFMLWGIGSGDTTVGIGLINLRGPATGDISGQLHVVAIKLASMNFDDIGILS